MTAPRSVAARGTLPWSGPRTESTGYGKTEGPRKQFDPLEDLHKRRTPEQLEELLAEQLTRLRARPDHHLIIERDRPR